jgi:Fe(3+) dicitrate transport protein
MRFFIFSIRCFLLLSSIDAISAQDTLPNQNLPTLELKSYRLPFDPVKSLGSVHQTYITSSKKNEVIQLTDLPANLAEKTGRQVFAKIPGAFVYDMDGSGNQLNLATRGLDPHRSWEYNVRQNDVVTNSDMYGYPASHYSPPMEAIQRIELIRGLGSLQYGAQFGGMVNYRTKEADTSSRFQFESIQSLGSFGLMSTYNAIGGQKGKLRFYANIHKRISDGYRENATSKAEAQFAQLIYQPVQSLQLRVEFGRSTYLHRNPGPLTDAQFLENPRRSTRTRNYFNPDILLPSITLDWKISKNLSVNWITSAVLGLRNSVQFIGFANQPDTILASTGTYAPRQVDIDQFNSKTSEVRLRYNHPVGTLIAGTRYINNDLHRRQQGRGTVGTDFNLEVENNYFRRDVHLLTENIAFFVEHLWKAGKRLEITSGVRIERGTSQMQGTIDYYPEEQIPQTIYHSFPLFALGAQYQLKQSSQVYGGWSQAYRPVIFADLIPPTVLDKTDPALRDAYGHNLELGLRGMLHNRLRYDFNYFQILYQNRVGTQLLSDETGASYLWKTNIGTSRTQGIESYLELGLVQSSFLKMSIFSATSFMEGKYLSGSIRKGNENINLTGNTLETVPKWISRNGLQIAYRRAQLLLQGSYVSSSFSDPLNTLEPTSNGAAGLVPAYTLWDLNLAFRIHPLFQLKMGVNNLTNQQYFTKRPTGYPGQGVWSSDGRGFMLTLSTVIREQKTSVAQY